MKINVSRSAGFCFGVRRAIEIALDTARTQKDVVMLGDIVHNDDVVRDVKRAGIEKVTSLKKNGKKTLLIRAHGAPAGVYRKARNLGYKIVDATCPKVTGIHRIVKKAEARGYSVIVIGDEGHDEVKGILGQLKGKGMVISGPKKISRKKIKKIKRACVVVQSTQDLENVKSILSVLKERIDELEFYNTICETTRVRQKEMRSMPLKNDVMLVIGSPKSANTKRLYEISKRINPESHWIRSARDIKDSWFESAASVGIISGASTPDYTTNEVIDYLAGRGKKR